MVVAALNVFVDVNDVTVEIDVLRSGQQNRHSSQMYMTYLKMVFVSISVVRVVPLLNHAQNSVAEAACLLVQEIV